MMPYPKISSLLNNSLLHALTPEVYQQIQAIACEDIVSIDPKTLQNYERLKLVIEEYYGIPSDNFTWIQLYYLLSAYNDFDRQIILGTVFRGFLLAIMRDSTELTAEVAKEFMLSPDDLIRHSTSLQPEGKYQFLSLRIVSTFLAIPLGLQLVVKQNQDSLIVQDNPGLEVPLVPQGVCVRQGVLDRHGLVAHWEKCSNSKERLDYDSRFQPILTLLEKNQESLVTTGLQLIVDQVNFDLKLRFDQAIINPKLPDLLENLNGQVLYLTELEKRSLKEAFQANLALAHIEQSDYQDETAAILASEVTPKSAGEPEEAIPKIQSEASQSVSIATPRIKQEARRVISPLVSMPSVEQKKPKAEVKSSIPVALPTVKKQPKQQSLLEPPESVPKAEKRKAAKPKSIPSITREEEELEDTTALSPEEIHNIQEVETLRLESFRVLKEDNIQLTNNQKVLIKHDPTLQNVVMLLHRNNLLSLKIIQAILSKDRFAPMVMVLSDHQCLSQFSLELLQCNFNEALAFQLNQLVEAGVLFPASLEFLCKNKGKHFPLTTVIPILQILYAKRAFASEAILEESKTSLPMLRWLIYLSYCNLLEPAIFKCVQNQAYFTEFTEDEIETFMVILAGITTQLQEKDYSVFFWRALCSFQIGVKGFYDFFQMSYLSTITGMYLGLFQSKAIKLTRGSLVDWLSKDPTGERLRSILIHIHCTVVPYFVEPFLIIKEQQLLLNLRSHIQVVFPYVELTQKGWHSKKADKIICETRKYLSQILGGESNDLNGIFQQELPLSFTSKSLREFILNNNHSQFLATRNARLISFLHLRQKLLDLGLHPMVMFELMSKIYSISRMEGCQYEHDSNFAQILIMPAVCALLNTELVDKLLNHRNYRSLLALLQNYTQTLTQESFLELLDLSNLTELETLGCIVNTGHGSGNLPSVEIKTKEGMELERQLTLSLGEFTVVRKEEPALYSRIKLPGIKEGIVVILHSSKGLAVGHLGPYPLEKSLCMMRTMITELKTIDEDGIQAELVGGQFGNFLENYSQQLRKLIVGELAPIPYRHDKWHLDWSGITLIFTTLFLLLFAKYDPISFAPLFTTGALLISLANFISRMYLVSHYSSTIEIPSGKMIVMNNLSVDLSDRVSRVQKASNWSPKFISSSKSSPQNMTPLVTQPIFSMGT